ncbi:MAG: cobalamin-dependent protein [Actinobacteria bacterium]|jgi:methylmalonyl-CoA mutase C-terminal domain/subunit|nr:cobalamin-dependent protein [Actinomycetota bacterium]MCL6104639.1 cobalamin-dependent protein [Actinomycetota bacterium]
MAETEFMGAADKEAIYPLKILVGKLGLDGHDLGARYVARLLKDQGYEVVYLGLHATPAAVARASVDEGADVIGISILSGAHIPLCEKLLYFMEKEGIGEVPLVVGGLVLPHDVKRLKELGVTDVFPSTEPEERFLAWFKELATKQSSKH